MAPHARGYQLQHRASSVAEYLVRPELDEVYQIIEYTTQAALFYRRETSLRLLFMSLC